MSFFYVISGADDDGQQQHLIGFHTQEPLPTQEAAEAKADVLNETWQQLEVEFLRDQARLARVKDGGFWTVPEPDLHGLAPAEVLGGSPFSKRLAQVTGLQMAILNEPFQKRFARIVALIEAPDPATVIS
ncbi:hypothetical protein ACUXAV_000336 [Cupriavidus metallidurans]|uniref:hypothetical protein n=1 Tax=Cupriavidus metallidurans TaxID=119219 RepID=UPI0004933F45|nr:hypothetical protein [Cupriavidus metallidurans]MDE4918297.1 hypothetical protein [Cupriavidus metallidurans]